MRPSRSRPVRSGPFLLLAIFLCPGAAGLMGWAGGAAAALYQLYWGATAGNLRWKGMLLGLGGGLVAGLAWGALMTTGASGGLRHRGEASPRLVAWGAFAGHAAVLVATAILLGGMMILNGRWSGPAALTGLVFAAVAGLAFGAVGGLLTWGAAVLARGDGQANGAVVSHPD